MLTLISSISRQLELTFQKQPDPEPFESIKNSDFTIDNQVDFNLSGSLKSVKVVEFKMRNKLFNVKE